MTEKIIAITRALCGARKEEEGVLSALAAAAERRVEGELGQMGIQAPEDARTLAAAWLAAADLLESRAAADGAERVTVGEVSVAAAEGSGGQDPSRSSSSRRSGSIPGRSSRGTPGYSAGEAHQQARAPRMPASSAQDISQGLSPT